MEPLDQEPPWAVYEINDGLSLDPARHDPGPTVCAAYPMMCRLYCTPPPCLYLALAVLVNMFPHVLPTLRTKLSQAFSSFPCQNRQLCTARSSFYSAEVVVWLNWLGRFSPRVTARCRNAFAPYVDAIEDSINAGGWSR